MTSSRRLPRILFALAAAYASTAAAQTPRFISPAEAVQWAAASRPYGKSGAFSLRVQSISTRGELTFLNSELDQRDTRNLSIALPANVVQKLETQYGPLSTAFIGKSISVNGVAKQIPVTLMRDGERTVTFYLQTEVRASDPKKIQFVADES